MVKSKTSKTTTDIPGHNTEYNYVLDWIREATEARRSQNAIVERAIRAYQGKPSMNRYAKTINDYTVSIRKYDAPKADAIKEACKDIPERASMVVHNAVETLVSMTQGGVGQYEFGPYDPTLDRDDKLMDWLASGAKSFYLNNKIDSLMPQYIRNAVLAGESFMHIKHKNGKKCVTLLDSSQMYTDPKRFKTNSERFIGHSQRESFKAVKDRVKKDMGQFVLDTINEAEVYVTQVVNELNSVNESDSTATYLHDELRRDLDLFYKPILTRIQENRKGPEGDPNYMYQGDEILLSCIYDTQNDIYLEIVNERYIIVAKKNPLSTKIKCQYWDAEGKSKTKDKMVSLDHPYVQLPMIKTYWDSKPISPLFYLLDDFDDLCAMESVLYHNLSIMAPLTFVGQSSDAEKVSRVASVAGEIVEGLPQTFGVLNKTHDITPVITAIQRIEERIKRTLKAVDPFELQAMIGDRASAKEVSSASGQVAQGVNPFLANIESAMATLGEKFFKLEVIFGTDEDYTFTHNGSYAELSKQQMAADYEITAKLQSSIKLEQEASARRAIELIQFLNGNEAVNQQQFLGTMIPIALNSLVNREQAKGMVNPQYQPMPDEVIAQIRKRAEDEARKTEDQKLDLSEYTPEELDALIAQESQTAAGMQAGVDPMTGMPMDAGMPPEESVDPLAGLPMEEIPDEMPIGAPAGVEQAPVLPGTPEGGGEAFNAPEGY